MPHSTDPELADRYRSVMQRVDEACRAAHRDPADITTVVVTKFHTASVIRDLIALGARDFGENRHQDAAPKAAELIDLGITWHFVGQLQSNKARAVAGYASVVHSVDRLSLVSALARADAPLDIFIEVNLTDDPARGGVQPVEVAPLAENVLQHSALRLVGVMAVAPLDEEPRAAFARLRAVSDELMTIAPEASRVSAGMSADFADAIAEGATHLRIGTAITGKRPERP